MNRGIIAGLALSVALAGCGSKEEKQAEEATREAATTAEQGAQEAAKGLEQMAKGLEAMAGGGSADGRPVEPVSFRDLMALFPDLDGWEKAKPTGEKMTTPFPVSMAEVVYTKGDARIELKMTDSGLNQMLLMPYAMFLSAGYEKETESGYEKATKVAGFPALEKFNTESKDGEVTLVASKRYIVEIEGNDVADAKVLTQVAEAMALGKLPSQ